MRRCWHLRLQQSAALPPAHAKKYTEKQQESGGGVKRPGEGCVCVVKCHDCIKLLPSRTENERRDTPENADCHENETAPGESPLRATQIDFVAGCTAPLHKLF